MKMNNCQWIGMKEFCKEYQIHEMTGYRMAKDRRIPLVKVGGRWKTRRDILDNWMAGEGSMRERLR